MDDDKKFSKVYRADCPFPCLVYAPRVTYREVSKPSGIAYIVMVLLSNSSAINDELSNVLRDFGIPEDLNGIFAREIKRLMDLKLIKSEYFDVSEIDKYFSQIELSDLTLTETGMKMFKNQAIPTGEDKVKTGYLHYDLLTRDMDFNQISASPYEASVLANDQGLARRIYETVDREAVKEFLNSNKSKLGIKKEEIIMDTAIGLPHWHVVKRKNNVSVVLTEEGVSFSIDNPDEKSFFEKFYSADTMNSVFAAEGGPFKFAPGVQCRKLEFDKMNFADIYIPGEIGRLVNLPYSIFIDGGYDEILRNVYGKKSANVAEGFAEAKINGLNAAVMFIVLDESGDCYIFTPVRARIPCPEFESPVEMDFLLKQEADEITREGAFRHLQDICLKEKISGINGNIAVYLDKHGNFEGSFVKKYMNVKLTEVSQTGAKVRVDTLLDLFAALKFSPDIDSLVREYGGAYYDDAKKDTDLSNVAYKYRLLDPLRKRMGISDKAYFGELCDEVLDDTNTVAVFDAFSGLGISPDLILTSVNVIKPYIEMILSDETISGGSFANMFEGVRTSLWRLNKILDIESVSDDVHEERINSKDFLDAYSKFDRDYKKIDKYRDLAKDEFNQVDAYLNIYTPIMESLVLEQSAQNSPKDITMEYIDQLINKGQIKNAVCELYIKLQYNLSHMLDMDMSVGGMSLIESANNRGYISKSDMKELTELRICRNDFQHPKGTMKKPPKKTNLNSWKEIVFALEVDDNESHG